MQRDNATLLLDAAAAAADDDNDGDGQMVVGGGEVKMRSGRQRTSLIANQRL